MASTATQWDPADTALMCHMDGADTSTTITDETGKTVNVTGDTQIDTAQSKFGGASCLFNADDDINVSSDADFDIDTLDFTIDFWVRFNTQDAESVMFRFNGNTTNLYFTANALAGRFDINVVGATKSYSTSVTTATWYHIAVVRTSGTVRFFLDGVQQSTDLAASGDVVQGAWLMGQYPGTGIDLDGWIDEYRIVKGTAVWTADFTPPAAAYTKREANDFLQDFATAIF